MGLLGINKDWQSFCSSVAANAGPASPVQPSGRPGQGPPVLFLPKIAPFAARTGSPPTRQWLRMQDRLVPSRPCAGLVKDCQSSLRQSSACTAGYDTKTALWSPGNVWYTGWAGAGHPGRVANSSCLGCKAAWSVTSRERQCQINALQYRTFVLLWDYTLTLPFCQVLCAFCHGNRISNQRKPDLANR